MRILPAGLIAAVELGVPISGDALRDLIAAEAEAEAIGLSFEEALEAARRRLLSPGNLLASDIALLVELLTNAD